MRKSLLFALLSMFALGADRAAHAKLITYTERITGTGTLGATSFQNASLTFTAVTNTEDEGDFYSEYYDILSVSHPVVTIGGLGSFDILDEYLAILIVNYVDHNGDQSTAGIGFATNPYLEGGFYAEITSKDLLNYLYYDAPYEAPPITGESQVFGNPSLMTSGGTFLLDGVGSTGSIAAQEMVAAEVPEPSSWSLLGVGLLGTGLMLRVRGRGHSGVC